MRESHFLKLALGVICFIFAISLAHAQNGPSVAKDPGTRRTVTTGVTDNPLGTGNNPARTAWWICVESSSFSNMRWRKGKTITSTTGKVMTPGQCYQEPIGGEKAYTGPIAVTATGGTGTLVYTTEEH